jgi:aminoglycoside phosphotransferase (APT) family kinase protein
MTADARVELVDSDRLARWLDSQGMVVGSPVAIRPLPGGTSNAMFVVERGAARWVLRRPAKVALEKASAGMCREFRILSALNGTNVPHPASVALCEDHSVLGCTFFLMKLVEGINPFPLPDSFDSDHLRTEVTFSMVDALAHLHDVDWQSVDLADIGHPDGFHERQVDRWSQQLASYNGREFPGIELVMLWLKDNLPSQFQPTLMHGDFHMFNALIAPEPPGRVVAMLDWETATIGDPLLDLAGFCEIWCSLFTDGWPSRQAMVDHYRETRGIEVLPDLTYYSVLYNFRSAVLLEGIYQRSIGDSTRPTQEGVGERALYNLNRAVELVKS